MYRCVRVCYFRTCHINCSLKSIPQELAENSWFQLMTPQLVNSWRTLKPTNQQDVRLLFWRLTCQLGNQPTVVSWLAYQCFQNCRTMYTYTTTTANSQHIWVHLWTGIRFAFDQCWILLNRRKLARFPIYKAHIWLGCASVSAQDIMALYKCCIIIIIIIHFKMKEKVNSQLV